MIEVKHLTKKFGPTTVLADLSFSVAKGEVLGFLGPNGAGKTTTMKILTGYWGFDAGQVSVAGFDMALHSAKAKRLIGYLPEHNPLYEEMKVFEYLKFIAEARDLLPERQLERIKEVAERCGLNKVIGKSIDQLSKGFRQRLGIAQAIIHNPDILILDEPTAGLDPNQILEIRQLIREIGQEKTVILSTHIMQEVNAMCDRVLIINRGALVGDGSPQQLALQAGRSVYRWSVLALPAEVLPAVQALSSVAAAQLSCDDAERTELLVEPGSADCRQDLAQLAAQRGWPVWSFTEERPSLEDIFKQLTI